MRLFSPAKINLFLKVESLRPDGYHAIETVMQTLDFGDWIEITTASTPTLSVECDHPRMPKGPDNLILRAARLFYDTIKTDAPGVTFRVTKNIPVGGGLGGGSSNAATVLMGLNRMHNHVLPPAKLSTLAAHLGSDAAFFVEGGTCLCAGRGEEILRRVSSRPLTYLLVFPGFASDTGRVYGAYFFDLTKKGAEPSFDFACLTEGSAKRVAGGIHNDLMDPFFRCYPEGKRLFDSIQQETNHPVFLSGSGSTFYFVCDNDEQAHQLETQLQAFDDQLHLVTAHTCHTPDPGTRSLSPFGK